MGEGVIYFNGRLLPERSAHLSCLDRGFTLGDGVFDTSRAVHDTVFRLEEHLDRLQRSASAIGLTVPVSAEELGNAVYSLLAANRLADALIRITLSRGVPEERGLLPPPSPCPSLAIQTVPFGGYPQERYAKGFSGALVAMRRNEASPLSYIKSCNYLDSVLARMQAHDRGADEALLLNTAGWLACGASSNLFLVSEGSLITPSLDCGVLDGVTRRTVLELAAALGLSSTERPMVPEELDLAEEAFVTNTAVGVMPLVAVDGRAIGRGEAGPIARRLHSAYTELLSPSQ